MLTLNVGCGDLHIEGAVNIDLRADVADILADVRALPYADAVADRVIALDLLEHFPADHTAALLAEWARVLRTGGELVVKVPNLSRIAAFLINGQSNPRHLIRNIYGGHRWGNDGAWDTHHTGWTPDLLAEELDSAGFDVESNNRELNMTVVAVKR